jgi:hypothetical protein
MSPSSHRRSWRIVAFQADTPSEQFLVNARADKILARAGTSECGRKGNE